MRTLTNIGVIGALGLGLAHDALAHDAQASPPVDQTAPESSYSNANDAALGIAIPFLIIPGAAIGAAAGLHFGCECYERWKKSRQSRG